MKRIAVVVLACLCLTVCSGCFRTVYRGEELPFNVAFNRPTGTETLVSHFEEDKWNHYFLFALVPTSEPDMGRIIGRHAGPGQEVRNLQIRHEVTFLNALCWFLVGGIYNPMTTTISGDVVRVQGAGGGPPSAPVR